jgi:hypothetical protein
MCTDFDVTELRAGGVPCTDVGGDQSARPARAAGVDGDLVTGRGADPVGVEPRVAICRSHVTVTLGPTVHRPGPGWAESGWSDPVQLSLRYSVAWVSVGSSTKAPSVLSSSLIHAGSAAMAFWACSYSAMDA